MQFFQIKKFMVNKAIKLNGVVNSNPAIMKKKTFGNDLATQEIAPKTKKRLR